MLTISHVSFPDARPSHHAPGRGRRYNLSIEGGEYPMGMYTGFGFRVSRSEDLGFKLRPEKVKPLFLCQSFEGLWGLQYGCFCSVSFFLTV